MPASYAHVPTGRAARYLAQLCRHGSRMSRLARHRLPGQGHGPGRGLDHSQDDSQDPGHGDGGARPVATATSTGTEGVIDFGWGRCTLQADADTLILHAEAADPQRLRQIEDGIAARLERIGRRDRLTVTWTEARAAEL